MTTKLYTAAEENEDDICGLCGEAGADKIAMPNYWPGQQRPEGELVHQVCEDEECRRAHAELTTEQREAVLRSISRWG